MRRENTIKSLAWHRFFFYPWLGDTATGPVVSAELRSVPWAKLAEGTRNIKEIIARNSLPLIFLSGDKIYWTKWGASILPAHCFLFSLQLFPAVIHIILSKAKVPPLFNYFFLFIFLLWSWTLPKEISWVQILIRAVIDRHKRPVNHSFGSNQVDKFNWCVSFSLVLVYFKVLVLC